MATDQQRSNRLPLHTQADFSGGINKSAPCDEIADNEMEECLNFNINVDKSLSTRKGIQQYNVALTGAGRVTSIFFAKKSAGTNPTLIVTTKQKIYKDSGGASWTDITGATTPPDNTLWTWRMMNDYAIGVNGTTVPQKYVLTSGACVDLAGSPPDKCNHLEIYMGRGILSADTDETSAIHGSKAGDTENWTAVGDAFTIYVDKDNGQPVMGTVKFFEDLIIFKRKGIYRLNNPTNVPVDMYITQLFDDIGCVSIHTVKQIGNELIWLDDDGVYALRPTMDSGDVAYSAVTKKIQSEVNDWAPAYLQYAVSLDARRYNQYRVSLPSGSVTTNNKVWCRDYLHGAWVRHEGVTHACYAPRVEFGSSLTDMVGGYDGKVYKLDVNDADEGSAYVKSMWSKRYHLGTPFVRKMYHRIYTEYQSYGSYGVGFVADFDYSKVTKGLSLYKPISSGTWDVSTWDTGKWDGGSRVSKDISLGRKARNVQLQYLNTQVSQALSIYKFVISASSLGRRGRSY